MNNKLDNMRLFKVIIPMMVKINKPVYYYTFSNSKEGAIAKVKRKYKIPYDSNIIMCNEISDEDELNELIITQYYEK